MREKLEQKSQFLFVLASTNRNWVFFSKKNPQLYGRVGIRQRHSVRQTDVQNERQLIAPRQLTVQRRRAGVALAAQDSGAREGVGGMEGGTSRLSLRVIVEF